MIRMSKGNRVLTLIALMAVASFAVLGLVFVVTTTNADVLEKESTHLTNMRTLDQDLSQAVNDEEAGLDDYVLSGNASALHRYAEAVALEADLVKRLRDIAVDMPRYVSVLDAMVAASSAWRVEVATPAIAAVTAHDPIGVARFVAQSTVDHVTVESGLSSLDDVLADARRDLTARDAAATTTMIVGVSIAFGFILIAFGVALLAVRRFGKALELDARQASVLNRFTEVISFATDDQNVAATNLVALGRLVGPDESVTHILNRSMDRAVPEATTGDALADVLPLHALERCAGVLRGTMYVADDLADDLSVHCPIYPRSAGTLACIPLISGESVGAVHLYWARPGALPLSARPNIARITEHAALAIGNRRLLAALHGQANTDPRTGLANSRAFDLALEGALAARSIDQTLSVLMIDVDHFKQFNDRHGHPAGDEALRAFGGVLRSCMREGDLAARYGGEEFVVLMRGVDESVASVVAERIRARTESTIISLAPGMTDRITVSIGIANAPDQGLDRVSLLRAADEALYQAKAAGRNRIGRLVGPVPQVFTPAGGEDVAAGRAPKKVATVSVVA
jgi:diguanylate cyclase (GGDEF)-like protein